MRASCLVLGLGAVLAGCSSYSPDLGDSPFFCGNDKPACPQGYACMPTGSNGQAVCVAPGVAPPDAPPACVADPPPIEPNDMISNAFDTTIESQRATIDFAGLAICPAGDVDTFKVAINNPNDNLEVVVQGSAEGALTASILRDSGASLNTASPAGGGKLHGWVGALPAGTYYVQVAAATSAAGATSGYSLQINTCTTPTSQNSCQ